MKKLLLTLLALVHITACTACAKADKIPDESEEVVSAFLENSAAEAFGAEWFFLPEGHTLIRSRTNGNTLNVDFKGLDYVGINAYANALYNAIRENGYKLFEVKVDENSGEIVKFGKAPSFSSTIDDEYFAGEAYCFKYTNGVDFYMLTINYYGSAGGTVGNGHCKLSVSDVTEVYQAYYKEF